MHHKDANMVAFSHGRPAGLQSMSMKGQPNKTDDIRQRVHQTQKAPGCERELTRQGASLRPVPRITCPPPCELNSLAIVVVHAHATHAAHTFANIHSPAKPTKTCSGDVGQHA